MTGVMKWGPEEVVIGIHISTAEEGGGGISDQDARWGGKIRVQG